MSKKISADDTDNRFYYASLISKNHKIFLDNADFRYFTRLLEKHLTNNTSIELIAYCLESSDLKFLLYQSKTPGLILLLKNLAQDYKTYYDKKHTDTTIEPFNFYFKPILNSDVLEISRKIHTNLTCWEDREFSSVRGYLYDDGPKWLNKQYVTSLYGSTIDYFNYLNET